MIKILHNDLIIDLCETARYLKYLPQQKRFIEVKKYMANAILGSDGNTIYHLAGTKKTFERELKSVVPVQIDSEEFLKIKSSLFSQKTEEVINLKKEVESLKEMISQQNNLIQQLLEKLS